MAGKRAGIERLSKVDVEVFGSRTAIVRWEVRDWLLRELRRTPASATIVAAFEAVGSTRPVVLTERQRAWLGSFLDAKGDTLPIGLHELRDGLRPYAVADGDLIDRSR